MAKNSHSSSDSRSSSSASDSDSSSSSGSSSRSSGSTAGRKSVNKKLRRGSADAEKRPLEALQTDAVVDSNANDCALRAEAEHSNCDQVTSNGADNAKGSRQTESDADTSERPSTPVVSELSSAHEEAVEKLAQTDEQTESVAEIKEGEIVQPSVAQDSQASDIKEDQSKRLDASADPVSIVKRKSVDKEAKGLKHRKRDDNRSRSHSPRRRRSRTRSPQRRYRTRSRSRSSRHRRSTRSRSPRRHRQRTRSHRSSSRRRRRSASLERRREERKRRHAERDERDHQRQREREYENGRRRSRSRSPAASLNERKRSPKEPPAASEKAQSKAADGNDDELRNMPERQRRTVDLLTSRTGGAYIPPAKLRLLQAEITDKASMAYQRIAWEALKKSIHGYINKVNVDNIAIITRELLRENILRGRGLLCRSIIQAQSASPTFTHVYAALVAIINSKFPGIGELLLKRLVIHFKRAFRRNDKAVCLSATRFIAHLVNQRVAHEILALEILTLLVETPTDDSVEVAIAFLRECGMKLSEVSSKGIGAIFEMLRNILHAQNLEKRVEYMVEVVFQVRKDGFKDHPAVIDALDLVEEDDQITHVLTLDDEIDAEDRINAFKVDDKYTAHEDQYKEISNGILGSESSGSGDDSDTAKSGESDSDAEKSDEDVDADGESKDAGPIIDHTETNEKALRRTIYLTINSSINYEECAHKLMKMELKPGQEIELCNMFLDCCAQQRTYEKFYGLLAQRFCTINKTYIEPFEEIFRNTYQTTHRLETNHLRNVSKFFAHLLFSDAISWDVLECIKLNEDDTTSSSRVFIKILFQELAEYLGLAKLNEKLKDESLAESLMGLFPKDNPRNTRFSINFFTSIGLGGLTDDLRNFLKNAPKSVPAINSEIIASKPIANDASSSDSSTSSTSSSSLSSSSSTSSDSSSSESGSSSSSSESDPKRHRKSHKKLTKKVKKLKKRKAKKIKKSKKDTKKLALAKVNTEKLKRRKKKKAKQSSSSSGSDGETCRNASSPEPLAKRSKQKRERSASPIERNRSRHRYVYESERTRRDGVGVANGKDSRGHYSRRNDDRETRKRHRSDKDRREDQRHSHRDSKRRRTRSRSLSL